MSQCPIERALYHLPNLAGGDYRAEQEEMPFGLFALSACAPEPK